MLLLPSKLWFLTGRLGGTQGSVFAWQVWDGTQCKRVRTMGGHQTRTGVLAWNSRILSSGSRDRNILQHDIRVQSDYVSKLVGHKSEVCGLKWSHDDRELASGGNDNQVILNISYSVHYILCVPYDKSQSYELLFLFQFTKPVRLGSYEVFLICYIQSYARYNKTYSYYETYHNKKHLIFLKQLLVWNNHSQQPILKLTEHTAAVKAITWSPHQSSLLASGGGTADRCIRFWNTTNGHQLNSIDTGSQVCNLAWSKNVNEIVSTHGYSQNQIMVWKYPSMAKVHGLFSHLKAHFLIFLS